MCLKNAHAAANKATALMVSSHTLQPVAVAQVPEWAKEYVRGQEAAFVVAQVGAAERVVCVWGGGVLGDLGVMVVVRTCIWECPVM